MIAVTAVRTWELDRTPDLVDLVSAARDAGHEVLLIERPMPDAVSVAALGRAYDMVAARGGVALEDAAGKVIDFEPGDDRLRAAARLWRRLQESMRADQVIGKTTDEAVDLTDKFLDGAFLNGLSEVRIIHGHGTGALRKAVAEFLKDHPHVARYTAAPHDQGGTGATFVTLKQ